MLEPLKTDSVLPADFGGVFYFTNSTKEEFKAKWGGVEYTFPPAKTTPLIVAGHTPEQTQYIRKKFARELAEREYYRSAKLKALEAQTPIGSASSFKMAAVYTEADLKPFIQQCLEPLPMAPAKVEIVPKTDIKDILRKDRTGKNVSRPLSEGESLMEKSGEVME